MKKYLLTFLCFVAFGSFTMLNAQKVLEEGSVTLEITETASDNEQMAMGLEMMKGSQTEVIFNKEHYITKMSMMGGMVEMKTLVTFATKKFDMLFDAMGQKMWIDTNTDEASDQESAEMMEDMNITYDKSDTKEVLGYNCYKMSISNPENASMKLEGYVTEEIKTEARVVQGYETLKFDGFPLSFTVSSPQFSMTIEAVDIKDTVDASVFELNTDGYKKMTMEEFKNAMGGMGGMGF